jgi:putative endonuclease
MYKYHILMAEKQPMAQHNEVGKAGEELAVQWLREHGYTILHCNWRHSHYELDIVATKGKFLHFVEVKALNYTPTGNPEDSVTKKKFKNLQKAADEYLQQNPGHPWIQYDILSITLYRNKEPEYFLIEDVFL